MTKTKARNVVIARVSERGDREDEHFHSPRIQFDAAKRWSKERGEDVIAELPEIDKSGKLPLVKRPGLLKAVEMVEAGQADHIVVAYFDRLVRSLKVQIEVLERVEKAGGEVFALDHGKLTNGSAATRLSTNMLGAVSQYYSEIISEKVRPAHERAVAQGVAPYAPVPGYKRNEKATRFVVDKPLVPVIREAFRMRDRGESINTIRRYLAEHGVKRSYAGVESMLASETYLGNVVFGKLRHDGAHPAIIDRDLFNRVQERKATRGRQAKSDRLLARQGVLVCETCGARMTATNNRGYAFYRCQHNASPDCAARATIAADRVEQLVVSKLKARRELMVLEGHASMDVGEQLHQAARDAKADVEAAVEAFEGVEGLGAAKRRIAELTERWQAAERDAEQHARTEGARSAMRRVDDWDRLTLDGRRTIIRAVIERVGVAPVGGLGLSRSKWDEGRVDVQFVGQG
jgi:DNA invertase Pin-like site-specific DNA recombinase